MNLNDKLNRALEVKQLRPTVAAPVLEPLVFQSYEMIPGNLEPKTYPTLEAGIKVAESVEPDEFGTRIIMVDKIGKLWPQLPIAETILHKYIIDDIQKNGGGYEVHLVENNHRT